MVIEPPVTALATERKTGTRGSGTGQRGLRHVGALDGLRGAAVAGVLVFHGQHLKGGWLGVDLFFVLSGYLITSLLLTEWGGTGKIAFGHFWSRRARRLFPAIALLLLAVALYAHRYAAPVDLGRIRGEGWATLLYVANWRQVLEGVNYFQIAQAPSPLQHTWSLAIEEQFYLFWPLIVAGLLHRRGQPSTILRASVAIAGVSAALMIALHLSGVTSDNSLYLGTHTRVAAIAMGAALAAWQIGRGHTTDPVRRTALEAVAWGAVLFLGFAWTTFALTSAAVYAGGLALCGIAVVAVIATVTHPDDLLLSRIFAFAPLRWLGLISYGLYLWHWLVFQVLNAPRTGLAEGSWPLLGLQTAVSIAIAVVSYFLVEMPIRRGALTPGHARVAIPVTVAVVVVALFVSTLGAVSPQGDLVRAAPGDPTYAVASDPSAPRLLVIGDSVALELVREAIWPLHDEMHVSVANASNLGCSLMRPVGEYIQNGAVIPGAQLPDCTNAFAHALATSHADVVLVMFGARPGYDVTIDGEPRSACDKPFEDALSQQLGMLVDNAAASGARVVVTTVPQADDVVVNFSGVADLRKRISCQNDVFAQTVAARPATASLVDLDRFICPAPDKCKETIDGVPLRPDGLHFRDEAAKIVARWLIPRTLARPPPN